MPTSDEELQRKAEAVQKLREQVTEAEAQREQRELDTANDVTMTQLEAEEAALRARLAQAKEAGKVASVKSGVEAPLNAAKEQLKANLARQKAAEGGNEVKGDQVPTSTPPEEVVTGNDNSNGGNS